MIMSKETYEATMKEQDKNIKSLTKPFCLEDRRNAPLPNSVTQYTPYYYEEHIKQAVQLLKEEVENKKQYDGEVMIITLRQLEILLDKIFGEALTK